MPTPLPESPNLDWLRKQAKRRLEELQRSQPTAQLADAQYALAKDHGFSSWRALKAHVDSLTLDGQLVDAAKAGKIDVLRASLDKHPEKLHLRTQPYEWTLLHLAAHNGQLEIVDLLLSRGLDVNTLEKGDDTTAMHWAAAAGHAAVVRRLADAGGDVIGHGDDHELEVIGWATCWDGCDDDAHRAVVKELMSRGARHHIFSAVAMNLAGEVREIVARDRTALSRTMSRFEDFRQPLHFAVRHNRPEMVDLLIELGADPAGKDGTGLPPIAYARSPNVDRAIHEALWARGGRSDLFTALALGEWARSGTPAARGPEPARGIGRELRHAASDGQAQQPGGGQVAAGARRRRQRAMGSLGLDGHGVAPGDHGEPPRYGSAVAGRRRRYLYQGQQARQRCDGLGRILRAPSTRRHGGARPRLRTGQAHEVLLGLVRTLPVFHRSSIIAMGLPACAGVRRLTRTV